LAFGADHFVPAQLRRMLVQVGSSNISQIFGRSSQQRKRNPRSFKSSGMFRFVQIKKRERLSYLNAKSSWTIDKNGQHPGRKYKIGTVKKHFFPEIAAS
jgi:hypothetical protein